MSPFSPIEGLSFREFLCFNLPLSACYAALDMWEQAAEDGKQCIIVNRSFVKGYFRAGLAYQNLGNLEAALDVVKRGLGVESGNADLKKMSREIEEAMRLKRVDVAIETANKLVAANEITDAYKTVDAALRIDPTNATLNNLMDKIRPKYERAEKARVAGLDRNERIKEEGDNKFKNADFEGAINDYTRCIEALRNDVSSFSAALCPHSIQGHPLALKCYANRAACYKQLSNFEATISDSTMVLEHKPDDIKVCPLSLLFD